MMHPNADIPSLSSHCAGMASSSMVPHSLMDEVRVDDCPHGLMGDDGIVFDSPLQAQSVKIVGMPGSGKPSKRKDAPSLNTSARGSKQKALTIASDNELMAGAMEAYGGD